MYVIVEIMSKQIYFILDEEEEEGYNTINALVIITCFVSSALFLQYIVRCSCYFVHPLQCTQVSSQIDCHAASLPTFKLFNLTALKNFLSTCGSSLMSLQVSGGIRKPNFFVRHGAVSNGVCNPLA